MRRRILLGLLLLGAIAGGIAWAVWPSPTPIPTWVNEYDLSAGRPVEIAPGTVVDRTAPPGWSHLVIKSLPRVKPDEVPRVPSNLMMGRGGTVRMATWMFTAFLADVVPERHGNQTRHRLRAVGLGLGAKGTNGDTVFTPETAKAASVELDWMQKELLTKGYATQRQAVMVVHGPTFALLDTPVWFRCGEKNKLVRYRYALLVDAATGRLDVLLWSLGDDGNCGFAELVLLNPDTIDEAELVVDPTEFNKLGIPTDAAFGVDRLPPGRRLPFPAELRPLAGVTRFSAEEARELEVRLRNVNDSPAP